ncbi:MAG: hypothetical protein LQ343_007966 [Gyalolechia ehrenbergii]|nr:MAG: hypothetical protein LQ343_007966 [Gyalolechia ehrenbergii]
MDNRRDGPAETLQCDNAQNCKGDATKYNRKAALEDRPESPVLAIPYGVYKIRSEKATDNLMQTLQDNTSRGQPSTSRPSLGKAFVDTYHSYLHNPLPEMLSLDPIAHEAGLPSTEKSESPRNPMILRDNDRSVQGSKGKPPSSWSASPPTEGNESSHQGATDNLGCDPDTPEQPRLNSAQWPS